MKDISLHDLIYKPGVLDSLSAPQLKDVVEKLKTIPSAVRKRRWPGPAEMAMELTKDDSKPWKPAKHLMYLSDKLAKLAHGEAKTPYLMVCMPPRHGKTLLCSVWFPLWLLSEDPTTQVMLASYAENFATKWGRQVRNFVDERGKEIDVKLRGDTWAANEWYTSEDGGMFSTGVGGQITGRGAQALIMDDLLKNDEEARSETHRENAWEWWQQTALTRLEPGGFIVAIGTRWHEDDVLGRLEAETKTGEGLDWEIIKFPAYAEDNDVLGRNIDDVLWPERWTKQFLEPKRKTMTPFA